MYTLMTTTPDGVCQRDERLENISERLVQKDQVIWLDLEQPTAQEMDMLKREFGFHPLAIEDATHAQHRPKIDSYDDHYFFIFYSVGWGKYAHEIPEEGELKIRQVAMFAGPNYLVTIHRRHIPEIAETMHRWEHSRDVIGNQSGAVVHALLDALVDNYFPVMDQLAERVEVIEEEIFEKFQESSLSKIFALKKNLLELRRVIAPSRDVLNIMLRRETPVFDTHTVLYLTDVYDHIVRVTDSVDTYRDLLSSALDGYLSMASNRMNQTMRVLTSSSIILMSMTLVAGIYGMNFKIMPELDWEHGYAWAIFLMIVIGALMTLFFRRKGWL